MPSTFSRGVSGIVLFDEIDFLIMKLLTKESLNVSELTLKIGMSYTNLRKHAQRLTHLKMLKKDTSNYPSISLSLSEKGKRFFEEYSTDIKSYIESTRISPPSENPKIDFTIDKINCILNGKQKQTTQ